ncbi:carbon-nitrogen hydrolase family protein [Neobacillus terrae]|uniref:carbon-nitrogen hydrolase family protein n=1 Tax=Neobacillus terrae TaxID=3034837 RepID=UPI00140BE366|nr:carbon-nitrogen hydrolase family protein [Neobacillus terrae]NHM32472.1 carbon-nitrogen hydrolase family protein [Neobacillus terrae]
MYKCKFAGLQVGSYPGSYERNWTILAQKTEELILRERPYLISYSELMTAPYFGTIQDDKFFSYAETMNGPTVIKTTEMAVAYDVHILGTFFEKAEENGQNNYYNTAFICSPTKGLIGKYRKVHLPKLQSPSLSTDEKYYFEQFGGGGKEFPVFTLDNGLKVGILICFDRSFPEGWKALTVQGVDVVIVPTATFGFRKDLYVKELQIRAMENNVFVLGVNKAGIEQIQGEPSARHHFGNSCLIDPFGEVISQLEDEEWSYLVGEIDLSLAASSKGRINWNQERKPEIYQKYLKNYLKI